VPISGKPEIGVCSAPRALSSAESQRLPALRCARDTTTEIAIFGESDARLEVTCGAG